MLVKFSNESKENWDEYLDTCVFAYNTARYCTCRFINFVHTLYFHMSLKHESSLFTPFEIIFGRRAIHPVDINEGVQTAPTPSNFDVVLRSHAHNERSKLITILLSCYYALFVG